MANENGGTLSFAALWDVSVKILIPLMVVLLTWMVGEINELNKQQAVTNGNRFTAIDGLQMEARIRRDMPPSEWRERIIELENCIGQLQLGRECAR